MNKQKVSINDIAKQLNISKTTVSFILNGKAKEKGISDILSKKVLKLVDELGYVPNQFARSLRTGKTNIIGLLVEDISDRFFANIAKNIEKTAHKNGYKIIYCSTENSDKRAREFLNMFWNLGVDGCIVTPTSGIKKDINSYVKKGMQIILFDRKFTDVNTDYVVINNEGGTYDGTTHLIKRGYKNIAYISVEFQLSQMEDRIKGYKRAIKENKLKEQIYTIPYHTTKSDYVKELYDLLKNQKDIDAILFGTNYVCIYALKAMSELGISVPDDIAVIAFDDTDFFKIFSPAISAIAQPIEELSQTVISALLERLKSSDKNRSPRGTILSTQLEVRESTPKSKHKILA